MDLGTAPRCSFRLAGILPSTSPPPLGERTRQSRWTTSHFDSHTMGDHEDEIPEIGEDDPTSTYDPPHEQPSRSGYDPSFMGRRYWFPGDETRYEPIRTSNVRYDIPDILESDPAYHVESEVGPGTTPGGTPTLFYAERFGGSSHIAPSIPMVEASSHAPPSPSVSNPIQIPGPR